MKKHLTTACLLLIVLVSSAQTKSYQEKYRPQFHFTPAVNWTNDPNGLVFYKGEYHLFYQYNPYGNRWGHMSWGHSVSRDLVHWKHLPLAIPEGNGTMIFSGSAVVDENNSSGFAQKGGGPPMVAIYTGNLISDSSQPDNYLQSQQLAYSLDYGRTWLKYVGNPVLDLHKKDFRDPCVTWYAPQKKWVMAVVLPKEHIVQLYASHDLIQWTHLSDFGPAGDIKDIWECPSLLEVPVENTGGKKKWVLFNSQQTTMQYFVGTFDGTKFVNENPAENIYRPDYGPDYYAGITYQQLPADQAPVLLGWANNWSYANDIPTNPWKGMMAIPRTLSLKREKNAWILYQQPVAALAALRDKEWTSLRISVTTQKELLINTQQCEISLEWSPAIHTVSGIRLATGKTKGLTIGYDANNKKIFMDRSSVGDTSFNSRYASLSRYEAPLDIGNNRLRLNIFFDHSIVEVFAGDGSLVMSMQIFPEKENDGLELFTVGGPNLFDQVNVWKMKSAW
jgi:fructan beta-fructosidase